MKRVMRKLQQMVSSDLQLAHAPVLQHGVFRLKRCALIGAATLRARLMAPSRSPQTLFMPAMKSTWRGPCAMALTRLELPSMFTITPSFVMAFALATY